MAKIIGHNMSVLHGHNKIVGRSDVNWSHIRPGGYLKILGHPHIYEIVKSGQSIYTSDFTVLDAKKILLSENLLPYLIMGDEISLFYKRYELMSLIRIINGGKGYKEGETVFVDGGAPDLIVQDGLEKRTSFTVRQVDEIGAIKMLGLFNKGIYIKPPLNTSKLKSIHGNQAVVDLQFISNDRYKLDRTISAINNKNDTPIFYINYDLPHGLESGVLSVNKWDITLTTAFLGADSFNSICEITNDFTPNIKLPVLLPSSIVKESIINKGFTIIDSEITLLKNKLEELEKKLFDRG